MKFRDAERSRNRIGRFKGTSGVAKNEENDDNISELT